MFSFFQITVSFIFHSLNIVQDDSAAQAYREQKHIVETFLFLHGCILYRYNPTPSNSVNLKKYSAQ